MKKKNTRAIGNRNKLKAKKYFESKGYFVVNCELNKICYFGGRLVCVHKDLLGADLLLLHKEKDEIIFVQVKTNKQDILDGVYEFEKYPFPECVKKWVVLFEPRIKEPIVKNA